MKFLFFIFQIFGLEIPKMTPGSELEIHPACGHSSGCGWISMTPFFKTKIIDFFPTVKILMGWGNFDFAGWMRIDF